MQPTFVAECFWAGVKEQDLAGLDERARSATATAARAGDQVRYLGSIFMRADEVVLCLFEGPAPVVHRVAQQARIPFERIVETTNHLSPHAASP